MLSRVSDDFRASCLYDFGCFFSVLAFLHMLENGANTMDWLKDPDVGPILLQISRIYTTERSDCVFPGFGHD